MTLSNETIQNLRQEYRSATLSEKEVAPDPISQFSKWFSEALASSLTEPNAMTLATATADGKPSARIMLLKGFEDKGFVFYTNYLSRKGQEITKNPVAALVFFWQELERQVRIEGILEKIDEKESEKYFHSRPRGSQIGAHASPQSREISGRDVLQKNLQQLEEKYKEGIEIPKPPHWGGYIVKPTFVEFWQGGQGRLHDRIAYRLENNNWNIIRLAP
ncbi:pyridoxamine 5'-phosphate oxidase [Arcticibacter tournemirensis]|uniref:Pyridoxine/pyridoxamine 5'-phosphate oxidase n=1 Tax=Arcticibacter tournemirensis TaxID=699437 RepID=A0A5M9HCV3_9SPHI|nr:pyridoxamine 5'-phosphate oxidase [Arcticibacter tournemirensis]KAA8484155.1 pyridoxamine 5'-phosphate oxidase [Arcticibacter tournemirensis]TQM51900.1 pyridoxamine 5'-phosphate oxidase [Arcticibacter tournemirensis]